MDRFARISTVFTKHSTESDQSGISYASIFTGNQADMHGIYRHPTQLSEDCYLISEAYSDGGFETFFWDGHPMASVSLGYGQGVRPEHVYKRPLLNSEDDDFQKILKKLQTNSEYHAFVMTSFSETHGPYDSTYLEVFLNKYPEERKRIHWSETETQKYLSLYYDNRLQLQWNFPETVAKLGLNEEEIQNLATTVGLLYESRIFCLDYYFGSIVEQIKKAGLLGESLIVFTADHGEILYREDYPVKWEHGFVLLPDVLEVPLIIYSPAFPSRLSRWDLPTRSIDVFPTMAGLSGISLPPTRKVEGVNLTPMLLGREQPKVFQSFSHTTIPPEMLRETRKDWALHMRLFPEIDIRGIWTAVRDQNRFFRWRHFGEGKWDFEAFDLEKDPAARFNIFDKNDQNHHDMTEALIAYKKRLMDNYKDDTLSRVPMEKAKEKLKSLGYME